MGQYGNVAGVLVERVRYDVTEQLDKLTLDDLEYMVQNDYALSDFASFVSEEDPPAMEHVGLTVEFDPIDFYDYLKNRRAFDAA